MKRRQLCNSHTQSKPFLFEISDPAQPGQIPSAPIPEAVISSSLDPRDEFSRLFMFEYADQNARTDYSSCWGANLSAGRFANNVARLFIFAQTHENRCTQFSVARPLCEFYLSHELRIDPLYLFHHRRCNAEYPLTVLL